MGFTQNINMVLETLNNWFNKNFLSLNFEKTQFTHFTTNNNIHINFHVGVDNKTLPIAPYTKFLGLIIDSSLNWKKHTAHLTTKLGKACYALQSLTPYLSTQTLVTVHYSLFHSVMAYGLLFWGNSTHSIQIFKLQKRAIRAIMGKQKRESGRELFKELKILTLTSPYILSLALFILKSKTNLVINSDQHSFYTRNCNNFFVPQANLTTFQKGVYYSGVKIFSKLPNDIKKWSDNSKKFKKVLRQLLNIHSFYSVEEYKNR
jgi:hypothetical protein